MQHSPYGRRVGLSCQQVPHERLIAAVVIGAGASGVVTVQDLRTGTGACLAGPGRFVGLCSTQVLRCIGLVTAHLRQLLAAWQLVLQVPISTAGQAQFVGLHRG